ncbi:hypothetical protein JHS3_30770 [Jeongeupia sp. HS-3]|uniref:hypothetical protein n=1 Tax=Jeongeupia sp. HS-3 TaxID=1009682 RepID=UPI0018A42159|nr:hypothetical protein [Jeongeupia sp. HS-3]BCL77341.1 hypothetical protein JHS3_30770 [Jeongeupia sp. HS-3]
MKKIISTLVVTFTFLNPAFAMANTFSASDAVVLLEAEKKLEKLRQEILQPINQAPMDERVTYWMLHSVTVGLLERCDSVATQVAIAAGMEQKSDDDKVKKYLRSITFPSALNIFDDSRGVLLMIVNDSRIGPKPKEKARQIIDILDGTLNPKLKAMSNAIK